MEIINSIHLYYADNMRIDNITTTHAYKLDIRNRVVGISYVTIKD